jgi:ATP-binding protein involved in chromosome partitioning
MNKDSVRKALSTLPGANPGTTLVSGEHVLWISACDTYASVRLQWPATSPAEWDKVAAAAYAAVVASAAAAGDRGEKVDSFTVEFVDHAGTVKHTRRWGGLPGQSGTSQPQAAPQPTPKADVTLQSPPRPAPAPTPAGTGSGGHAPIGALRGGAPANISSSQRKQTMKVIAVGAGKGGVGKSTIALNLAVGLARRGKSVGLLDADIYGPSMPTMLGLDGLDAIVREQMLEPFFTHGVKAMTMGKLVASDKPLIWRGPMAHGAFKQLFEQTNWGDPEYLIIDLPPGTGDIALTMAQSMQLSGAVVVCTPQKVAQDDAVRAAKMFQQLNIDVLGVVENMSYFVGDDGKVYDIFGRGGAEVMAQRLGVPFLGAVPITMSLRANSDSGDPTANFTGTDDAGKRLTASFEQFITNVESQVALAGMKSGTVAPTLSIS